MGDACVDPSSPITTTGVSVLLTELNVVLMLLVSMRDGRGERHRDQTDQHRVLDGRRAVFAQNKSPNL